MGRVKFEVKDRGRGWKGGTSDRAVRLAGGDSEHAVVKMKTILTRTMRHIAQELLHRNAANNH